MKKELKGNCQSIILFRVNKGPFLDFFCIQSVPYFLWKKTQDTEWVCLHGPLASVSSIGKLDHWPLTLRTIYCTSHSTWSGLCCMDVKDHISCKRTPVTCLITYSDSWRILPQMYYRSRNHVLVAHTLCHFNFNQSWTCERYKLPIIK